MVYGIRSAALTTPAAERPEWFAPGILGVSGRGPEGIDVAACGIEFIGCAECDEDCSGFEADTSVPDWRGQWKDGNPAPA
ncbi:hypothetical protein [Rhodococcus wratislaviensis]|uniref:hypothetical protein n=1 Tax=Rhodococcus wratislaviensis TaxID=44752 RepID=UPI001788DB7D|nr:hypothetical protein [Rhodococcus wratislaviensis]